MGSWLFDDRDYYADDELDDQYEKNSAKVALLDSYETKMQKLLEKRAFEVDPKRGKFAHAYDHSIDNCVIIQLREKGQSLRKIAEQFNCSPSTIRNRLREMGLK